MDTLKALDRANARLKSGKIGVSILQVGRRLYLQATLPPKPNSSHAKPHQQRIALGIYFNPQGVDRAEHEAKKLGGLLACKEFSWSLYLDLDSSLDALMVGDAISQLEQDYFSKRSRTPTTISTWESEYLQVFKKIPSNEPLSETLLKKTIWLTEPNTRSRRRYALACAALADFIGIEHRLRSLTGNYSLKSVKPRSLPSDSDIALCYRLMPNNHWAWIYGTMAAYGLRNHEVFYIDLSEFPVIFVEKGKTEQRHIYPLYPEWAERWNLQNRPDLPFTGKNNSDLGNRIGHGFRRMNIPFSPYNLRHAWAVRSLEFGMDISLAAAQMGHSVSVHCQVYHHWISKEVYQRAYRSLLERPDRPIAPMS